MLINRLRFYLPSLGLIIVWGISVLAKLKFNGLVYGFDYGNFQPDGKYYTYRTLVFLGHSPSDAAQSVVNWYSSHGFKMNHFSTFDLTTQSSDAWRGTAPRILYPLLSIPFVAIFGIQGMLAVPAFSLLGLMFFCVYLGNFFNLKKFGFLVGGMLTLSPTVMRWMIVNCTDSLFAGLFSLSAVILLKYYRSRYSHYLIGIMVFLTSMTRFALPIWLSISFIFLLHRRFSLCLSTSVIAIISYIPTFLLMPKGVLLPSLGNSSGLIKALHLPLSFFKVAFFEISELAVLDRLLLSVIALAFFISIRDWRKSSSQYFLAVLTAVGFIGALNGTVGVNFRYQLPVIPFMLWVLFDSSIFDATRTRAEESFISE